MKRPRLSRTHGFTLLELLTVIAIIIVLAGLIISGMGYAQQKAAASRAQAEIAALGTALESYKADNGEYPKGDGDGDGNFPSDALSPLATGTPASYVEAGKVLYIGLRGNRSANPPLKQYFEFKESMLSTTKDYMIDPFGNAYGYSTKGDYNPTFDLWSTGGQTTSTADARAKWITNWTSY